MQDGLLDRVTADLVAYYPDSGYAKVYQKEERTYWTHLPGWIDALPTGGRVLDIGAAYGTLAIYARRRLGGDVVCTDVLPGYAPHGLLKSEGMPLVICNAELDDLPAGPFDAVILSEVLEHFNFHPAPTLRKIHAALRPGGTFLLSTPDAAEWGQVTSFYPSFDAIPQPTRGREWMQGHIWQYSRDELVAVLEGAGFRIEALEYSPGVLHRHFNVRCHRP